jgi:hypothetical protein
MRGKSLSVNQRGTFLLITFPDFKKRNLTMF